VTDAYIREAQEWADRYIERNLHTAPIASGGQTCWISRGEVVMPSKDTQSAEANASLHAAGAEPASVQGVVGAGGEQ